MCTGYAAFSVPASVSESAAVSATIGGVAVAGVLLVLVVGFIVYERRKFLRTRVAAVIRTPPPTRCERRHVLLGARFQAFFCCVQAPRGKRCGPESV